MNDRQFKIGLIIFLMIIYFIGLILFPDIFFHKICYRQFPNGTEIQINCSEFNQYAPHIDKTAIGHIPAP